MGKFKAEVKGRSTLILQIALQMSDCLVQLKTYLCESTVHSFVFQIIYSKGLQRFQALVVSAVAGCQAKEYHHYHCSPFRRLSFSCVDCSPNLQSNSLWFLFWHKRIAHKLCSLIWNALATARVCVACMHAFCLASSLANWGRRVTWFPTVISSAKQHLVWCMFPLKSV